MAWPYTHAYMVWPYTHTHTYRCNISSDNTANSSHCNSTNSNSIHIHTHFQLPTIIMRNLKGKIISFLCKCLQPHRYVEYELAIVKLRYVEYELAMVKHRRSVVEILFIVNKHATALL